MVNEALATTNGLNPYRSVLAQKIVDSVRSSPITVTRRDVWVPSVAKKALAVIGMRRTGKTSFLWQQLAAKQAAGTPRNSLLYLNFEDERLAGMQATDLGVLLEEFYRLFPQGRDKERITFYLDEIQLVSNWELFVRRAMDTEQIDFVLSGSSAHMLSREVATSMRGRAMESIIYPFSFRETLRHAGQEPEGKSTHFSKREKSQLEHAFASYLVVGGFPEAQGVDSNNRAALLNGYVDAVLLRDVIERHAVSHPIALRLLVRRLLSSPTGNFSVNKFFNDLKSQSVSIAKETLHAYLAHLEDAFLVQTVSIETTSEKQRQVNPRKVYPLDMGLIPLFDRSDRANIGHALETAVAIELLRRRAQLTYVRTKEHFEVDFLARHADGVTELVQACASLDSPEAQAREFRALQEAGKVHPKAAKTVVAIDIPPLLSVPKGIRVVQAAQWFMER
jgi:uncharacterized protein